jgi:hypothetical protein
MKCEAEDAYDDMYPEFAPESIVVGCEQEVHGWVEWEEFDPETHEQGVDVAHLCVKHYEEALRTVLPYATLVNFGTV